MPDTCWPICWDQELRRLECEQSGDEFVPSAAEVNYCAGWSACMAWEARVPPEGLDPEARELWCSGFDEAMDAPLGSAPDITNLAPRAGAL